MRRLTIEHKIRLRLFMRLLPGYLIFFLGLAVIGFMAGNMVGVVALFIAFICIRYKYLNSVTYHSESTKICIALSVGMFAISAIPLALFNTTKSLIVCVPVAIAMTWFLYVLGLKTKAERRVKELTTPPPFDLDNCTEEELRARCKLRFTRDVEYKTERAIKHFILKLPHEEIDVNPEQSKKERYRFRKILE